jgi:NAD(P)-dependent dehydrogenase (short-subunit alcohol dehydrogenase family)
MRRKVEAIMDTMPAKVRSTLFFESDSNCATAALNMAMKLLSLDVKDKGIAVCSIHPGFMRTEMTASVGFDKYWDDGGGMSMSSFEV